MTGSSRTLFLFYTRYDTGTTGACRVQRRKQMPSGIRCTWHATTLHTDTTSVSSHRFIDAFIIPMLLYYTVSVPYYGVYGISTLRYGMYHARLSSLGRFDILLWSSWFSRQRGGATSTPSDASSERSRPALWLCVPPPRCGHHRSRNPSQRVYSTSRHFI